MNMRCNVAVQVAVLLGTACAALTPQLRAQTLVWEDNFNGPAIDGNTWTYDVGNGCQIGLCGWGNGEMQYYTSRPENARIENGRLVIEARREAFQGMPFTSARLKTEGRMHFKYGTLEARIKTPVVGNGLWPAYWMLGTIGVWPGRGEIDLMEAGMAAAIANGTANRRIGAAVHWDYNGAQADYDTSYTHPVDLHNDFHVYRMTWDPNVIRMSIDGQQHFEFAISNIEGASLHEFHQQHYLLLNLAVGGTFTGINTPGGVTAPLPGKMEVDYLRLYQNPGASLYVGAQHTAPAGRFGVFTDQTDTAARLTFGQDAQLYLWNNLSPIAQAPFEGGNVMAYRANAGTWYGLGIQTDYRDMRNYAGGSLKLHLKTTTPSTFKIGINTSFGDSWVDFVPGGNQYGLVRDGVWHEVSIPFIAFYDLDLQSVKQMFMLVADPPASPVEIAIDKVYYQSR
ncbi:glycoside hydrolase family 16 protein [Xanthomonas campestris]|uniref:Exported glucan endo-1,3-beta-D-glucosidase n=1 Tax=Xanthomonas campestris pv. campestris (strain B100) TaxID=509169 RepID=B0RXF0_XANCB|nr:glycoside hydrolase family 16 protein [Xanthomonas campestris]MCD0249248.1 glycoside hydrolase family 16 protein [Xanthomonas campestris pv. campestris]MCD0256562.1 glycoside hydrolase family 16 protein [Xanthomonas campestris pv. campestris]MCD0261870.1 glycoside hydrolase family 16 protein [Xanthomonas campestris pv. campestris]MCD0270278.1 glycoside hydrolase family 16 protein [Xanthomonas campestris pv. campestris]MDO0826397.1 glycoside hydrolase family 16 protein [Xanthomonas campestri